MDKKALIHLWLLKPSDEVAYFLVPLPERLQQLKDVVNGKRERTVSLYEFLKTTKGENVNG